MYFLIFIFFVCVHCTIAHTGTVVPECYKDDDESQWKSLKLDPPPSENA